MDLFHQDDDDQLSIEEEPTTPNSSSAALGSINSTVTYDQVVRDLIQEERQYLRDLHLIMKVFREQLATLTPPPSTAELDAIFSNIEDIYELTVTLLGSLEDTLEVAEEQGSPPVGCCFEELAEAAEFDVYDRYAKDVLSPNCRDTLQVVLSRTEVSSLQTGGHGFREAVRYYLPKLLVTPVYHCFTYFDVVRFLHRLSPSREDRESLEQVEGLLKPLQVGFNMLIFDGNLYFLHFKFI